jgi:hypothetical protein
MASLRRASFVLLGAVIQCAQAASPSVTAVLTSSETSLGTPVQLEIKITGASGAKPPERIQVDGLDIRYTGESQNFVLRNFQSSSSTTLNYTIMPLRTGMFKIPPQAVAVGGATLKTPELTLQVVNGPNRAAGSSNRPPRSVSPGAEDKLAFAELIVPKKSAYVGEIIPVVLRIGFDSRARVNGIEPPNIGGQGFTMQKLRDPERNLETIGGRSYITFTYKTAIAAARTGNFEIGPAETKVSMLVPRQSSATRRMPFDPFDGDDPFADPFFRDPFSAFLERREVSIKSDPVPLEVKPLPPDAPPSFSGAVGNFSMTVDANPKRVQIGDPITINAKISGRGNFDRVNAPELTEERGWHKYPPSSKFNQDDDVGISGEKMFEIVVSPTEPQKTIPPLAFSYFDPVKEKYTTLTNQPLSVTVEGNPAASPGIAASAAPVPAASAQRQQILQQINERGKIVRTFAPIYLRKEFWLAQLVPLLALFGIAGWKLERARTVNRLALRNAQWRREMDELLRKLRRDQLEPREYFSDASRVVQLKTALRENLDPGAVDADVAARVFALDPQNKARLQELFATNDELRYSGSGNGAVSPERRKEALELIDSLS